MDVFPGAFCAGVVQTLVGHPFDTAKVLIQNNQSWRGRPVRHFYRGAATPLASSILFNSIVFPTYHWMNQRCNRWVSGAFAGLVVTPAVFLVENVKIILQMNQKVTAKRIITTNALPVTTCREISAMAIYFGTYDTMREHGISTLVAGGLSGVANWGITYPLDVIRSRQVAQSITFQAALSQRYLYRGLSVTLLRAGIVNACIFYTFEAMNTVLRSKPARA